jgi:penicillin-binding protein 1C
LTKLTYELGFGQELLPQKPFDLPQTAPHLLQRSRKKESEGKRIQTTIDVCNSRAGESNGKRNYYQPIQAKRSLQFGQS